jgi:hypothetical protein
MIRVAVALPSGFAAIVEVDAADVPHAQSDNDGAMRLADMMRRRPEVLSVDRDGHRVLVRVKDV